MVSTVVWVNLCGGTRRAEVAAGCDRNSSPWPGGAGRGPHGILDQRQACPRRIDSSRAVHDGSVAISAAFIRGISEVVA